MLTKKVMMMMMVMMGMIKFIMTMVMCVGTI